MIRDQFKKVLMVCLLASLTMTAFGCSSDSGEGDTESPHLSTAQETISLEDAKQPLTFIDHIGNEAEATEAVSADAGESDAAATTAVQGVEIVEVTEYVDVTDENGEVQTDDKGQKQTEVVKVTEVVPVTDANGEVQTDANGQTQTEVVPVTETIPVTESEKPATVKPADSDQSGGNSSYSPSYDQCKAYWLDMSQEGDFFFEGEFLVVAFELNEDIPNGTYPVTIATTDIASWDMVQWTPEIINGEIAVNVEPNAQEDLDDTKDFTLKVNSQKAKPGDIVELKIDLKNNPGFCGFVISIQYDKAAMSIVETWGGENFVNTAINYVAK